MIRRFLLILLILSSYNGISFQSLSKPKALDSFEQAYQYGVYAQTHPKDKEWISERLDYWRDEMEIEIRYSTKQVQYFAYALGTASSPVGATFYSGYEVVK